MSELKSDNLLINNKDRNREHEWLVELDWIRAITALLIMVYHYTTLYEEYYGHVIPYKVNLRWAGESIGVFFMLSGFLSMKRIGSNESGIEYLKDRAKRLYPTYWVCVIVTSIFLHTTFPRLESSLSTILVNLTMFQDFFGVNNVDRVYWTLALDIRFYLLIALIKQLRHQKYVKFYILSWILISIIIIKLQIAFSSNIVISLLSFLIMPNQCTAFASGVFLYYIFYNKVDIITYISIILAIVLGKISQSYAYLYALAISIVLVCISLALRKHFTTQYTDILSKLNSKPLKPLSFISSISYPLYLLHQFIGFSILWHLDSVGAVSKIHILLPIAFSITLAWIVNIFIKSLNNYRK